VLRWCVGTMLALGLLAAPAHALPDDPPFAPLAPADGAALPVDPDGIPVSFSCPGYRIDEPGGFPLPGGARDYGVSLARAPATGADGRLADPVALSQGAQDGPDRCAAALGAGGSERPQETPGTYYWQVWRLCTGCPGSYEVGPVRRLVLRAAAKPAVRPPRRVYGGFPFILPLALTGVPDFTVVRVQRRSGARWVAAGSATALRERAEATVTLPRGRTRLRVVARLGDEQVTSPEAPVTARRARRWKTGARDDGRYTGRPPGLRSVRVAVAGGGRRLRGFTAQVPMLCPTPGMVGQFTTQVGTAAIERIKVAPDGSFVGAATPERATSIRVRGRLRGRAITSGRVELSVGACQGSSAFSARRSP
jgi:hypothetical protein